MNINSTYVNYFGPEHLSFLFISLFILIAFEVVNAIWIKSIKVKKIEMYVLASLVLIFQVLNRIGIIWDRNWDWWQILPGTICSITSLVLGISCLFYKKENPLFQSIPLLSIIGGLLNDIYPNYLQQNSSFFYLPTITGMIHHTLAIILSISLFAFGFVKLDKRKWYMLPVTFTVIFFYSLLVVELTPLEDCANITKPMLSNSIFYGPVVALISFPVYALLLLVNELIKKHIDKKKLKTISKKENETT